MKKIAVENTHWVQWDAPKIGDRQRAVCGELTEKASSEPTCPECQKYLEDVANETIESRFG